MLWFIAILFILYCTFFIGQRIGTLVPDEVVPGRKYILLGADAILLITIGVVLYPLDLIVALFIPLLLIALRALIPYKRLYAPLSGITLAVASFSNELLVVSALGFLVMNFLRGATSKDVYRLAWRGLVQPLAAIAVLLAL